jgi:hypothetical protein
MLELYVLPQGASAPGLAFKAREIEELVPVYVFRPIGMVVARAARALGLTPTHLTLLGAAVGVAGGALLYDPRLGLVAFALLIVHGILDSSDGQLARMTGQVTELGRLLDGMAGYVAHVAIYLALIASVLGRGGGGAIILLAAAAAVSNIIHAQLYDYHRTAYAQYVIHGQTGSVVSGTRAGPLATRIIQGYEAVQTRLAGAHPQVERALAARSRNGLVRDDDRGRYRASFYWPVRGWNLFGDNMRFYAIGVLAWLQRPEWFFAFLLVPMNVALACVWLWQLRVDRRFLAGL